MESRRAEAAQVGNDRAVAGGMKGRKDAVPGARIVGPAVKQERRRALCGPESSQAMESERVLKCSNSGARIWTVLSCDR